jgi:hypothetical protein
MRGVADPILDSNGSYGDCRGWSLSDPSKPLYSRTLKRYSGQVDNSHFANINLAPAFLVFGGLGTITIDVPTAYTGQTNPLLWHLFGQFGGHYVKTNGSSALWDPVIDLPQAGKRTITSSGVTGPRFGQLGAPSRYAVDLRYDDAVLGHGYFRR